MEKRQEQYHSHLFTLRIWSEELGDDRREWRGQVEHIVSGERYYFRDWSALIALLLATLAQLDREPLPPLTGDLSGDRAPGSASTRGMK